MKREVIKLKKNERIESLHIFVNVRGFEKRKGKPTMHYTRIPESFYVEPNIFRKAVVKKDMSFEKLLKFLKIKTKRSRLWDLKYFLKIKVI